MVITSTAYVGIIALYDTPVSEPTPPILASLDRYARMVPWSARFLGAGVGALIGWYVGTHWRSLTYPMPRFGGFFGALLGLAWPEVFIYVARLSAYIFLIALFILIMWWLSKDVTH